MSLLLTLNIFHCFGTFISEFEEVIVVGLFSLILSLFVTTSITTYFIGFPNQHY